MRRKKPPLFFGGPPWYNGGTDAGRRPADAVRSGKESCFLKNLSMMETVANREVCDR